MEPCNSFVCDYPFDCPRFYKEIGLEGYDHGIKCCEYCDLFSCDYCSVTIKCSLKEEDTD